MPIAVASLDQLPEQVSDLLLAAQAVAQLAYNPYSHFFVGAAVEAATGAVYRGTFMENASLGLTICAEPAALLAANSNGDRIVRRIAIVGGESVDAVGGTPVTPCGRCRQILFEAGKVAGRDIEVYCANMDLSEILVTSGDELLPLAFWPGGEA